MTKVLMGDPTTGRVAQFTQAPGVVNEATLRDYNSDINAPLNTAAAHLDKIDFHTDTDLMEIAFDQTAAISHAAVSSVSAPSGVGISASFGFNDAPATHTLLTHNLGYLPHVMVSVGNKILWPGMPVQVDGVGGSRFATVYVTETQVLLYETSSVGSSSLAATTLSYRVLVFRKPPSPSGNALAEYDAATGEVKLGFGRISSKRKYLQVVPGGSPMGLAHRRTTDLHKGSPRYVLADGSFYEPVPANMAFRIQGAYTGAFGVASGYGGAYAGDEIIQVQPPVLAALGQPNEFKNENGEITIVDAGYVVSPANGKLISLLQTPVFEQSVTVAFPDFTKSIFYAWQFISTFKVTLSSASYRWYSIGDTFLTIVPQEWTQETILGPAPTGADLLMCRVKLTRTSAPSHTWSGQAVNVAQPQNLWVPLNGTIIVEREIAPMMTRAFSLYIKNGNLVLHRQQSVGSATGNYSAGAGDPASRASSSGTRSYGSTGGVPVLLLQHKPSDGVSLEGSLLGSGVPYDETRRHRWDGDDPCSTSDPTNYSSEYLVDIYGQFGRRS